MLTNELLCNFVNLNFGSKLELHNANARHKRGERTKTYYLPFSYPSSHFCLVRGEKQIQMHLIFFCCVHTLSELNMYEKRITDRRWERIRKEWEWVKHRKWEIGFRIYSVLLQFSMIGECALCYSGYIGASCFVIGKRIIHFGVAGELKHKYFGSWISFGFSFQIASLKQISICEFFCNSLVSCN